jgi:hypothetical protein
MTSKPASHRSPVLDLRRPEPRLPSALLHSDDRVISWLGRLYGGQSEQRELHGLEAPFEHDSAHLNPHDVLVAFIEAARAGRERNLEAVESSAPTQPLAG